MDSITHFNWMQRLTELRAQLKTIEEWELSVKGMPDAIFHEKLKIVADIARF